MSEHKATLTERTKNLMKANDSAKALDNQLKAIEKEYEQLSKESKAMDAMLLHIVTVMQSAMKLQLAEGQPSSNAPLNMPDLTLTLPSNSNPLSTPA